MTTKLENLHWLDYVIFAVMLLISCGIGIYYAFAGSKNQSKESFLMGNRQMKWLPVAISLVASFNSGITQLGMPAEVYQYGIQYWLGTFGVALSCIVSAYTFLPMVYRLHLTSSYEYLELRFKSKAVRGVGSFLIITYQVIYIGIATFIPAIAIEAVTGFPVWASILCVGAVATFYTTLGGMTAVVWTDAFQSVIMVCGMLAVITSGILKVGGLQKMWEINQTNNRLNFLNFDPDPTVRITLWSMIFGSLISWLSFYSINQTSVQRYCSVSTLRKSRLILLTNIPAQIAMDTLACFMGLVLFSYFSQCDPMNDPNPDGHIASPNQLVPMFVMKVVGWPGIPGVFLASIFSGSLSTVSSCLNALAAVTWEDILKWKFHYVSEKTITYILKGLVLVYGLMGILAAFLTSYLQGSVLQVTISFLSTSSSPLMGLFILGAFFTRANWLGAIVGGLVGLAIPMWLSLGSYMFVPGTPPLNTSITECAWNATSHVISTNFSSVMEQPVEGINKLYTISFMWFPVIGLIITILLGLLVSLLAAPFIDAIQPNEIRDCYLILPLDRFCTNNKNMSQDENATDEHQLSQFKIFFSERVRRRSREYLIWQVIPHLWSIIGKTMTKMLFGFLARSTKMKYNKEISGRPTRPGIVFTKIARQETSKIFRVATGEKFMLQKFCSTGNQGNLLSVEVVEVYYLLFVARVF